MNNLALSSDKKRSNTSNNQSSSLWRRVHKSLIALRPYLAYYLLIIISIAAIDFLIRPLAALDIRGFAVGQFSPRGVTAPFEFTFVDKITTQQKQQKAEALVSPIYILKPENLQKMQAKISQLTDTVHKNPLKEGENPEEWVQSVLQKADFPLDNIIFEDVSQETTENDSSTQTIPKSIYESLIYYREYESLWKSIDKNIKASVGRGIAEDVTPLNLRGDDGKPVSLIAIPVTLVSSDGMEYAAPVQEIRTPMRFFEYFNQLLSIDFPDPVKDKSARQLALAIVETAYSGPTLIYDKVKTEKKKEEVRKEVSPVIVQVYKEDSIIGKNELLTDNHLQKLNELQSRMRISFLAEIGYLVLSLLFVLMILKYLEAYQPEVAHDLRKTAVILLCVLLIFALSRIAMHISLLDQGNHKLSHVAYAVPLGALGVILTLLITSRMALFCCALCSIYMGIIFSGANHQLALPYILVVFITSCASIYAVARIRQRSDLYRAGGLAMILACVLILALSLNQFKNFEQLLLQAEELKWSLIWGGVNGGLISIFSMALLPIFEDFYGVVTDMKLLELSQKNELLQRLEQEAPGSYQHSMRVATIAETAAEAIGANALLTRVGCYYHDIGKIMKAQYFVENQQTNADKAKHSKLTTNMSCFLIRSHVKHGLELGIKNKLPKVILDFIPEHHGTTLMNYFYHKALEEEGSENIKESDFRYPGPKPQSKETAIAMLSDAVEAASRMLESGNERDVRQLVRKMINERFMDEQFDECNLTLKDLHTLFLSFSESIISMQHQRIAYPSAPSQRDKEIDKVAPQGKKNETDKSNSKTMGIDTNQVNEELDQPEKKPVAFKEG